MGRWSARAVTLTLLAGGGAVACGGKSSARPPQSASASTSAPGGPAPVSGVRTRIDPNAELLIYLDARGFRSSPFFDALEGAVALIPGADARRARLTKQCGFDPVQSIEEVAVSVGEADHRSFDKENVLIVTQFNEPPERVLGCVAAIAPWASATQLEGRDALESPDHTSAIVGDGSLLLAGPRLRVVHALSEPPAAVPALEDGTYLQVHTSALQAFALNRSTFSVRRQTPGTLLSFVDQAPSAEAAARTEVKLEKLRELARQHLTMSAQTPDGRRYASALLDSVVIETKGMTTSATLDLSNAEAEAAFTGMLMGVAMHGLRRYLGQAKAAEARLMVPRIAQGLTIDPLE